MRLISLAPNVTEIIFALDAEEMLIGVDDYSVYPPEASDLPHMGTYLAPNMEAIVAANPDAVFILDTDENAVDMLTRLGINVVVLPGDTVSDTLESIATIGEYTKHQNRATEIIRNYENTVSEISSALDGIDRVSVVLVIGRNPGRLQDIYVSGGGSFLSELIEIAGGANVFGDTGAPAPLIGVESIIERDPDIILDSTLAKGASDEEYDALVDDWSELESLKAVQTGRVYAVREGWIQIPGAHLDESLRLLASWFHPEIFGDFTPDGPDTP